MNMYMLKLPNEVCLPAIKVDDHFESLDGSTISKSRIYGVSRITKDQIEFEATYRQLTIYTYFSKNENLTYAHAQTAVAYNVWRIAKGYPIDDAGYLASTPVTDNRLFDISKLLDTSREG